MSIGVVQGRQDLVGPDLDLDLNRNDPVYLVSQRGSGSGSQVSVYALGLDDAELTRIFTAGSRNPLSRDSGVFAVDGGRLLISVGGSTLALLDVRLALEIVAPEP